MVSRSDSDTLASVCVTWRWLSDKKALGVLGLGSLLLTQVRYEHPASIKDAEAQELATREAADMGRADSASAQLIRDGLDGLPADPTGFN
jgi:hypothetical protein